MQQLVKLCENLPKNTIYPMEYTYDKTVKPLAAGIFLNYPYLIISHGTHPCCYVQVPVGHPQYGKEWEDVDIECHGGITFSETKTDCWIGWDYAHCGDQYGPTMHFTVPFNGSAKKWTTEELLEDVKSVINQLKSQEVIEGEIV